MKLRWCNMQNTLTYIETKKDLCIKHKTRDRNLEIPVIQQQLKHEIWGRLLWAASIIWKFYWCVICLTYISELFCLVGRESSSRVHCIIFNQIDCFTILIFFNKICHYWQIAYLIFHVWSGVWYPCLRTHTSWLGFIFLSVALLFLEALSSVKYGPFPPLKKCLSSTIMLRRRSMHVNI